MNDERILALDMSTKTGWASMVSTKEGIDLEAYGMIDKIAQPDGEYPGSYVHWAFMCYSKIMELVDKFAPDVLVIEETCAGSNSVYSQKILEFIHFLVAKFIKESSIKAVYLLTGAWRSEVGSKMTKKETLHNKAVKAYKEAHDTKVAKGADGKRIGKLTKKHINIRRANEVFGKFLKEPLKKKNEDEADALLLGYCYHLRRIKLYE